MLTMQSAWNRAMSRFAGSSPTIPPLAAAPPARAPVQLRTCLRSVTARCDRWAPQSSSEPFRILSLDGGGARGVLEAVILRRLAEEFPDLLSHRIDLIAGTSTGGLLALLLASGQSPAACVDVYKKWIPEVFAPRPYSLLNIESAKYGNEGKLKACEAHFGDSTLGDLKHYVVVPAFRLNAANRRKRAFSFFPGNHWRPALFSNLPAGASGVPPDNTMTSVDVAMSTTAAPTFFPVWKGMVDGGVFANNPSLLAVARVFNTYPHIKRRNVKVLSLGAGHFDFNLDVDPHTNDWGLRAWWHSLVEMLLAGQSLSTDSSMAMLLRDNYKRFDITMERDIPLDAVEAIAEMEAMAMDADIEDLKGWVETHLAATPRT